MSSIRRFSLRTVLVVITLALGIGVGWWVRGATWQDELNARADQIAVRSLGVYIPELGVIMNPPREFLELDDDRQQEIVERMQERTGVKHPDDAKEAEHTGGRGKTAESPDQSNDKETPIEFNHRICDGPTGLYSYAEGKQFGVHLPERRGPRWNSGEPNPPLTVVEAIKLAVQQRERIVKDEEEWVWFIESASLTPWKPSLGYWYWEIEFVNHVTVGGSTGTPPNLRVVVLMDGTVIEPVVNDYRR